MKIRSDDTDKYKSTINNIINTLKFLSDKKALEGMAKFGINPKNAYGVSIPNLRKIAKDTGKDHDLALKLWFSGIHEARILASMVDDPEMVTEEQMDSWAKDFDSWDVCDQCCNNLFYKTKFAYNKAEEWSGADDEFVKRAGFVMMSCLSVHEKKSDEEKEEKFMNFLLLIKKESSDERNFIKKAVNWALRQIGKRSINLNIKAVETAREIQKTNSKSAKWVAYNAIRELTGDPVQKKLKAKSGFLKGI